MDNGYYILLDRFSFFLAPMLYALTCFISPEVANGQKLTRVYYDAEWKGTTERNASFYRELNLNSNGQVIGGVIDYYITGEIQGRIDSIVYLDKRDDKNTKIYRRSVGYYRNGVVQFIARYEDFVLRKIVRFNDDGGIYEEINYDEKGKHSGPYRIYYPSGRLYRELKLKSDSVASRTFIECDEAGLCKDTYEENFKKPLGKWILDETDEYSAQLNRDLGTLILKTSRRGLRSTTYHPIVYENSFSIATTLEESRVSGNATYGMIWGFKDWSNYSYFLVSTSGKVKIGRYYDGLELVQMDWTSIAHGLMKRNNFKIHKIDGLIVYALNGTAVYTDDFIPPNGNNHGVIITNGPLELNCSQFIISNDIDYAPMLDRQDTIIWKGNGSGIFIDKSGYILTNAHVIDEASYIEVEHIVMEEVKSYTAEIIYRNDSLDLAILKIVDSFNEFDELCYSVKTSIDVGTEVFALGFPLALSLMGSEVKFTDGRISARSGYRGDRHYYQSTTPIQPGNSGGPLFDYDGNLVGINTAILRSDIAQNVSYSLKMDYLDKVLSSLPKEKILLPNCPQQSSEKLTMLIKKLTPYVVMIRVR